MTERMQIMTKENLAWEGGNGTGRSEVDVNGDWGERDCRNSSVRGVEGQRQIRVG